MSEKSKKSKIRILTRFLMFSMILTNLASCAQKSPEKKEASSKMTSEGSAGEERRSGEVRSVGEKKAGEEVKQTVKKRKKRPTPLENELVWKMLSSGPEEENDFVVDEIVLQRESGLNKLLEKKGVDYRIRIEPFSYGDESYEAMKKKEDTADLLSTTGFSYRDDINHYLHFVKEGFFIPLDSFLKSKRGRHIKENLLKENLELAKIGGRIYGLSTVSLSVDAMVYDTEALKKSGIEPSEIKPDFFDNMDLLRKLRKKTKTPLLSLLQTAFLSMPDMWILNPSEAVGYDENGKFINVIETKTFREGMKKLLTMRKEGIVQIDDLSEKDALFIPNNSYFSTKKRSGKMKFVDPKKVTKISDGVFEKEALIVPNPKKYHKSIYRGDYKTGITPWTKKREWAEDFLEKLFADPDIANILRHGERAVNVGAGKEGDRELPKEESWLGDIPGLLTNEMITLPGMYEEKDKKAYMKKAFAQFSKDFPYGFRFEPATVMKEIEECNKVIEDRWEPYKPVETTFQRISALEVTDMDKEIDTLLTELKEAGVDKIIKEANRQLEKWKKEKGK